MKQYFFLIGCLLGTTFLQADPNEYSQVPSYKTPQQHCQCGCGCLAPCYCGCTNNKPCDCPIRTR